MIVLHIAKWDENAAWTSFTAYHPRDLERRLTVLTGHGRSEVKKLVRRLKDCESFDLPLPRANDSFAAEPLRGLLESVGAAVTIQNS